MRLTPNSVSTSTSTSITRIDAPAPLGHSSETPASSHRLTTVYEFEDTGERICLPAVLSSTRQRVGVSALAERAPLIGTLWDNSKMTLGDLV